MTTDESHNIDVNSSYVSKHNLVALRSEVEDTNLILQEAPKYVERFAPEAVKGNDTMKALYAAEKEEITEFIDNLLYTVNNAFLKTADFNRLVQWEKILKMTPYENDDTENRRMNIIQKMAFKPPFTRQNLGSILRDIWGDGDYTFEINPDAFTVVIDIRANDPQLYLSFQETIRNIIPANMDVVFSIQYTYLYLNHQYTYGTLSADANMTYGEMSKYRYQSAKQLTDSIWVYLRNI